MRRLSHEEQWQTTVSIFLPCKASQRRLSEPMLLSVGLFYLFELTRKPQAVARARLPPSIEYGTSRRCMVYKKLNNTNLWFRYRSISHPHDPPN